MGKPVKVLRKGKSKRVVKPLERLYNDDGTLQDRKKPGPKPKPKPPKQRRIKYSKRVANLIAKAMGDGRSLVDICDDEGLTEKGVPTLRTIYTWIRDIPDFRNIMNQAYIDRADYYMEDMLDIFEQVKDKRMNVQQAKFLADQYRWILEKLHPKYLEKASQTIQIGGEDNKVQFNITLAPDSAKQLPKPEDTNGQIKGTQAETDGSIQEGEIIEEEV